MLESTKSSDNWRKASTQNAFRGAPVSFICVQIAVEAWGDKVYRPELRVEAAAHALVPVYTVFLHNWFCSYEGNNNKIKNNSNKL